MPELLNFNPVHALDINANIVEGAVAYFYRSGTSNLETVYSDAEYLVPHPSPLPSVNGRFPQVYILGANDVDVDVKTSTGASLPGYPLKGFRAQSGTSNASNVTATPFGSITSTDVQGQLQQVHAAISGGQAAFGIGITGNAVLLANIDATNISSGAYRYDGDTAGTFPSGVVKADEGIIVMWRRSASTAVMTLYQGTQNVAWTRIMQATTWGAWRRVLSDNDIQSVALSSFYESTPQTITAGGALTLAHGLGEAPKLVQVLLKCETAELGYSIGDITPVNLATNAPANASYGQSITLDATNVGIRFGATSGVYQILRKDTGAAVTITAASWSLIVRAWA